VCDRRLGDVRGLAEAQGATKRIATSACQYERVAVRQRGRGGFYCRIRCRRSGLRDGRTQCGRCLVTRRAFPAATANGRSKGEQDRQRSANRSDEGQRSCPSPCLDPEVEHETKRLMCRWAWTTLPTRSRPQALDPSGWLSRLVMDAVALKVSTHDAVEVARSISRLMPFSSSGSSITRRLSFSQIMGAMGHVESSGRYVHWTAGVVFDQLRHKGVLRPQPDISSGPSGRGPTRRGGSLNSRSDRGHEAGIRPVEDREPLRDRASRASAREQRASEVAPCGAPRSICAGRIEATSRVTGPGCFGEKG
jgi:hypothetical protein